MSHTNVMRAEADAFELGPALLALLDAAEEALAAPDDDAAVHGFRVALKRARALARVGKVAAPGMAGIFNDNARALMAGLSDARDAVALADCARSEAKKAKGVAASALKRTAIQVAPAAADPLDRGGVRQGLNELRALVRVWPAPSRRQLKDGVVKVRDKARRAYEKARGQRLADLRHDWRKREKDRLYAVQLAAPIWPRNAKLREMRGKKLARALGGERELLLLIARLEAEPHLAGGKARALAAITHLKESHGLRARKADRLGRKLHRGGQ